MNVRITYGAEGRVAAIGLPQQPPADLAPQVLRELEERLAAMPLQFPRASAFRRRVWEAIRAIPFGQTVTYQELARRIGHPRAARAVGAACAANRLLLAVPCHRVVGSRGPGGFALGPEWKRKLLELEGV